MLEKESEKENIKNRVIVVYLQVIYLFIFFAIRITGAFGIFVLSSNFTIQTLVVGSRSEMMKYVAMQYIPEYRHIPEFIAI